jgi:translation elongation factor EF-1alpha
MDDPTVNWSKKRFNSIINTLRPFLSSFGYDPDTDCLFIPISGLRGDNIDKPLKTSVCNWYKDGGYLLQVLDNLPMPPARDAHGPLIIPVFKKT